jgi:D-aminopeptidase
MGIARTGTYSHDGSGDIFLALGTGALKYDNGFTKESWSVLSKKLDPVSRLQLKQRKKQS